MDLSGACPSYQTDKQYTVQINSSCIVCRSYKQNHYKIYRLKASQTFTSSQLIRLILQYFAKIYATVSLKVTCKMDFFAKED